MSPPAPPIPPIPPIPRDAERSRARILDAATALFAARGYAGATVGAIAAEAGVARSTPSYFYASKEGLYAAVLARAFAEREAATEAAFAPVHAWAAEPDAGAPALRAALRHAVAGYLDFLLARPDFVRLVAREELDGGTRLALRERPTTAMAEAFGALRAVAPRHGVREFDVGEAILVFLGLTFWPLDFRHMLLPAVGLDVDRPAGRDRLVALAVEQIAHLVAPTGP